jgi:hypothetical protein
VPWQKVNKEASDLTSTKLRGGMWRTGYNTLRAPASVRRETCWGDRLSQVVWDQQTPPTGCSGLSSREYRVEICSSHQAGEQDKNVRRSRKAPCGILDCSIRDLLAPFISPEFYENSEISYAIMQQFCLVSSRCQCICYAFGSFTPFTGVLDIA